MVKWGGIVFVVGVLATMIAMSPLAIPGLELSGAWWFLSMLTGVGFLMMLLGLLQNARQRRRSLQRLHAGNAP